MKTVNFSCPDACRIKAFSVELSSSDLSTGGMNSVLHKGERQLVSSFHKAREMQYRLHSQKFERLMRTIDNTIMLSSDMDTFLRLLILDDRTSTVTRVKDAIKRFRMMAHADIHDKLLGNLEDCQMAYDQHRKPAVDMIVTTLNEFCRGVKKWSDVVDYVRNRTLDGPSAYSKSLLDHTSHVIDQAHERITEAQTTLTFYIMTYYTRFEHMNYASVPQSIFANTTQRRRCESSFSRIQRSILLMAHNAAILKNDMDIIMDYLAANQTNTTMLDDTVRLKLSVNESEQTMTLDIYEEDRPVPWNSGILRLVARANLIQECASEYGQFLTDVSTFMSVLESTDFGDDIGPAYFDPGPYLETLRADNILREKVRRRYATDNMTLAEIANIILDGFNDPEKGTVKNIIEKLGQDMKLSVINPLQNVIEGAKKDMLSHYQVAMRYATDSLDYLENSTTLSRDERMMDIWRIPKPVIDSPQVRHIQ